MHSKTKTKETEQTHPFLSTVVLKPRRLGLAFSRCFLVLLERVHDVILVETGKVDVPRLPAPLALGSSGDDRAFPYFGCAFLLLAVEKA